MAYVNFKAVTAEINTGVAAKTVLQLVARSNQAVRVKRIQVTFQGVTATDPPIIVELVKQTDAGTMSALTLLKEPPDAAETIQTTAQHTATAEPTTTTVRDIKYAHNQGGTADFFYVAGRELKIPGGERLGVRVTNGGTACDCVVVAECEE